MIGTKTAQLAVTETPTLTVTVSLVFPSPPVQYIEKLHTPAATVCAGRLVNPKTVVTPPGVDWIAQARFFDPPSWSMVGASQAGAAPVPCTSNGIPPPST